MSKSYRQLLLSIAFAMVIFAATFMGALSLVIWQFMTPAAAAPQTETLVYGVGVMPCHTILAAKGDMQVAALEWVSGFVTGIEAALQLEIGKEKDTSGELMELVTIQCTREPTDSLSQASMRVVTAFVQAAADKLRRANRK